MGDAEKIAACMSKRSKFRREAMERLTERVRVALFQLGGKASLVVMLPNGPCGPGQFLAHRVERARGWDVSSEEWLSSEDAASDADRIGELLKLEASRFRELALVEREMKRMFTGDVAIGS